MMQGAKCSLRKPVTSEWLARIAMLKQEIRFSDWEVAALYISVAARAGAHIAPNRSLLCCQSDAL